jgi:hypothetical protein
MASVLLDLTEHEARGCSYHIQPLSESDLPAAFALEVECFPPVSRGH